MKDEAQAGRIDKGAPRKIEDQGTPHGDRGARRLRDLVGR